MEKHVKICEPNIVAFKVKKKRWSGLSAALLKAFAISLLLGFAYGISIFVLGTNIALFPIIGVLVVSYVYNSNYQEEQTNICVRPVLGLICAFQIIIGFLVCELFYSEIPLYPINIYFIAREYIGYTLGNPLDQGLPIFLSIVCFAYGVFQDHAFRFQKIIKRPFMRKRGSYYYKKEGHIVSIFLIDPMQYDDKEKNRLIAYITEGCYIEKNKNKINAFYLPKENIDEAKISIQNDSITKIKDNNYYKIDLGSRGILYRYTAPCSLIMDDRQNVLVMEIEI